MATQSAAVRITGVGVASAGGVTSPTYDRFAAGAAIVTGVSGLLYAISFVVLRDELWSGLFLLLAGLFSTAALVAVYGRLRVTDASWALLALLLTGAGALGSTVHAGSDLANALHPPPSVPDLPSPVDPRGLMTFGVAGLGFLVTAWLMSRNASFPKGLGPLGYALAVVLIALYLARLIILDATSPIIVLLVLLAGFVLNPLWYLWLGVALWRATPRGAV
jgi:hypothetical protein